VTPNSLDNLDLSLFNSDWPGLIGVLLDSSVSPLDNVEHIYQSTLPAGWYSLEASGPVAAAYALSFQGVPEARFSILVGVLFLGWAGRRSGRSLAMPGLGWSKGMKCKSGDTDARY